MNRQPGDCVAPGLGLQRFAVVPVGFVQYPQPRQVMKRHPKVPDGALLQGPPPNRTAGVSSDTPRNSGGHEIQRASHRLASHLDAILAGLTHNAPPGLAKSTDCKAGTLPTQSHGDRAPDQFKPKNLQRCSLPNYLWQESCL